MMKINPGTIQTLEVLEAVEKGYLIGFEDQKVFLPKRELKQDTPSGTKVEAFTYYNEERELEATTRIPNLQVGQIGCFRVANGNELGSFISIGTKRDILIPKKEQIEALEEGRMALVILCNDDENKRLYASTKLNRYLRNKEVPYKRGDEVSMIIAEKIEIGRRVVIDGKYIGVLFRQEMTDKVRLGEKIKGFIRKVEDNDIVVSMQREGLELLDDSKAKLMLYLEQNGGYVRLNDDTDPEEIKLRLHMSKKAFKKAAGMLFKEGKVLLTKFGVKINKSGELPKEWEKNKMLVEEEEDEKNKKENFFTGAKKETPVVAKKSITTSSYNKERDNRNAPPHEYQKPRESNYEPKAPPSEPRKERQDSDRRRDSDDDLPPIKKGKQLTFKGKK